MKKAYTLITGVTSGIGLALAREFANRGHNLLLVSRNRSKLLATQKEFPGSLIFTANLNQANAAEKIFKFCQQKKLYVEILVNNAGICLPARPQAEHSLPEIVELLNINLISALKLSTLFGREMQRRHSGYILNIASTAAFQPMPYGALYGATKAFLLHLSEAMAMELKDYSVSVTAVCPGLTATNFFRHGKPTIPGWLYRMISAETVAQRAVAAMFKKKIYVIPYFQHWFLANLNRLFTRHFVARTMKRVERFRKKVRR